MLAPDMRPLLYSTVITTGGNSLIPNYMDRVQHEVRSIAPCDFEVEVPRPLQR
jgi:actin-related protein